MLSPFKSLIAMGLITICSRILGFIRDTLIAKMFGASMITDAFFVAFKLPNLLRRIFAEGVFYQVFLPILSEYKYRTNKKELRMFVARVFGLLIVMVSFVIFIGLLLAPWIVKGVVPGFDSSKEKFFITVTMFRIMLPYVLLISLTSLMGAILNAWNFFLVSTCVPIFLNISMIGFILFLKFFYCNLSIIGLAWSVLFGGVLQCIYCLPFVKKIDMLVFPKINFMNGDQIFNIFRSMGPVLITSSGVQISLLINTALASFLQDGSISWMYYADRLIELPVGVFGVTLSTFLLSYLSRYVFSKNDKDCCLFIHWGIKICCTLSFPSAVILIILSKPLIITVFQYGEFSEFDVLMTQYSLIVYALGLPGLILIKILTSVFYAYRDFKTPMRILVITIIFGQFINLICLNVLKHVVFALSVSIVAWINVVLLFRELKKKYFFQLRFNWLFFYYRLLAALVVVCLVCWWMIILISDWNTGSIVYRIFRMIGILMICGSSYIITLWCLGSRLRDFLFFDGNNKNYF